MILCWLALLLIRIAETTTGQTWRNLRHELDLLHLGVFTGNAGTVAQTAKPTPEQRAIYAALDIAVPPRFTQITPA